MDTKQDCLRSIEQENKDAEAKNSLIVFPADLKLISFKYWYTKFNRGALTRETDSMHKNKVNLQMCIAVPE